MQPAPPPGPMSFNQNYLRDPCTLRNFTELDPFMDADCESQAYETRFVNIVNRYFLRTAGGGPIVRNFAPGRSPNIEELENLNVPVRTPIVVDQPLRPVYVVRFLLVTMWKPWLTGSSKFNKVSRNMSWMASMETDRHTPRRDILRLFDKDPVRRKNMTRFSFEETKLLTLGTKPDPGLFDLFNNVKVNSFGVDKRMMLLKDVGMNVNSLNRPKFSRENRTLTTIF